MFSYEIFEIFKDTYFEDYLRTTTFKQLFLRFSSIALNGVSGSPLLCIGLMGFRHFPDVSWFPGVLSLFCSCVGIAPKGRKCFFFVCWQGGPPSGHNASGSATREATREYNVNK